MIPSAVLRYRDKACAACLTPCALKEAHEGPCDICPLTPPAWPQWDCNARPSARLGDRLAEEIKTRVLDPFRPYAPTFVAAIEKCGGCKADQRALNGGGLLKGETPTPEV